MTFPFDEENRKRKASAFTLKRNEDNEEVRRMDPMGWMLMLMMMC